MCKVVKRRDGAKTLPYAKEKQQTLLVRGEWSHTCTKMRLHNNEKGTDTVAFEWKRWRSMPCLVDTTLALAEHFFCFLLI